MTNIELYINKQLCDIQSPEKLGVRLNRVLINPAELSTKDAQYSYSITIPSSPVNDAIFGYANVEEVKNKFNHQHTAQLYVDSVLIFDGLFKMSEIDSDRNYKGNLVVPAKKTIKEIFGDKKMTEIEEEWPLELIDPFTGNPLEMVEVLNKCNTDKGTPKCIFPLVLYGLLPKVPQDEAGTYSGKTLWDKHVRLGIEDFPPSINCMQAIKAIFEKHKDANGKSNYSINGNAFDDERLTNLYMSYQNPTDYQQEWNWGHLGHFKIKGSWTNYKKDGSNKDCFEKYFYINDGDGEYEGLWDTYTANLFKSSMLTIDSIDDNGTNVMYNETPDTNKKTVKKNVHITIPKSGLYKINLDVSLALNFSQRTWIVDKENKNEVFVVGENNHLSKISNINQKAKLNNFSNSRYEVKLVRDFGEDFDITDIKLDGLLYKDNLPQEKDQKSSIYFPKPSSHCVQMVDPLQNSLLLSGFRWGDTGYTEVKDGELKPWKEVYNKAEAEEESGTYPKFSRILAIKNGWSWDKKYSQKHKIYSAVSSDGYRKQIGEGSDIEDDTTGNPIVRGWVDSTKFKVELSGAEKPNQITNSDNIKGTGYLNQVVWLEKGEHLTLVAVSDQGHRSEPKEYGWMVHDIDFTLEVQPFKKSYDWITVDNNGKGTKGMNWNDSSDFQKDYINLIKFLPSEQKIDEWLDNFCKAFNLELTQPEDGKFELNIKQSRPIASVPSVIDLDGKASIVQRTNQPLGLPSEFQLGFKVNQEEEGYVKSPENNGGVFQDGGGSLVTGNLDGQVVTQTSNFSYNWLKKIIRITWEGLPDGYGGIFQSSIQLQLPVIANKEIWGKDLADYADMLKKLYTNYAQRFWYKNNQTDNVGVVWKNKAELQLPQLKNNLNAESTSLSLDYYNTPNSILNTYFSIIATDDSNYTYVECYLTPDEYEQLNGGKLVKLNNDLYYIAAIEGYDPTGRNKTKLKLIRKI